MKKVLLGLALATALVAATRDNEWVIIPHQPPAHKSIEYGHEPDGSSWVSFEVDPLAPSTNQLWFTLSNIYSGETRLVGPILPVQGKPAAPMSLRVGP